MTEVEEVITNRQQKALKRAPRQAPAQLDRIRKDTLLGMALSNVVAQKSYWSRCHFYPLTAAYHMLKNGAPSIGTSEQTTLTTAQKASKFCNC